MVSTCRSQRCAQPGIGASDGRCSLCGAYHVGYTCFDAWYILEGERNVLTIHRRTGKRLHLPAFGDLHIERHGEGAPGIRFYRTADGNGGIEVHLCSQCLGILQLRVIGQCLLVAQAEVVNIELYVTGCMYEERAVYTITFSSVISLIAVVVPIEELCSVSLPSLAMRVTVAPFVEAALAVSLYLPLTTATSCDMLMPLNR